MTKTELVAILVAIAAISICAFAATDSDGTTVTEDGAVYELIEGGGDYYAEVSAYDGTSPTVVIKSSITYDGIDYPVVTVADGSFSRISANADGQAVTPAEDMAKRSNITAVIIEDNDELQLPVTMFKGLNNLQSIEIGEGITELPDQFLMNCTKLSSVSLPSSLRTIGDNAFTKDSALTSIDLSGVVTIGTAAFSQTGLTSVVIPDSVTEVGNMAFYRCYSLTEVTLGEGVVSIGPNAFYSAYFKSIHIPAAVSEISKVSGQLPFPNSLESFTVSEDNEVFYADDGILYTKSDNHIYYYPVSRAGEVTLDYDVPEYMFSSTMITKATLLDGVTSIGASAFGNCSGLTEVIMSDSVTSIGNLAFNSCMQLAKVTMSENVKEIPSSCFRYCSSLESLDLSGVTSIGEYALANCVNLAISSLPDGLESIGSGAFYSSRLVNIGEIPSGVTSIGAFAFRDAGIEDITVGTSDNVVTVNFTDTYPMFGGSSLRSVTLDNVILTEGSDASKFIEFGTSANLERIVFGTGFTDSDFIAATAAAFSAVRPDNFVETTVEGGVTTLSLIDREGASVVADGIVYELTSLDPIQCSVTGYEGTLTALVIPECTDFYGIQVPVTSIGTKAFYKCTTLVSADLGSIEKIGTKAFAWCSKLKSVDSGDSLKTVSAYAFYRCVRLADADFDDSMKTLKTYGSYSFYKCGKLSSMIVPSSMTTIGKNAFTMPIADENGVPLEVSLDALKGYAYENVDGVLVRQPGPDAGKEFASGNLTYRVISSLPIEAGVVGYSGRITALTVPETVTDGEYTYPVTAICDNAFYKCRTLTSADLGNVEVIGTKAFYGCNKLTSVMADDLEKVGIKAFGFCTALTDLEIGDDLKTICAYGFYRCTSLTSFDAPESLETLGSYAFYRCSALQKFDAHHSSLKLIGSKVFSYCPSLTTMMFPSTLEKLNPDSFDGMTFRNGYGMLLPHTAENIGGYAFYWSYAYFMQGMLPRI